MKGKLLPWLQNNKKVMKRAAKKNIHKEKCRTIGINEVNGAVLISF